MTRKWKIVNSLLAWLIFFSLVQPAYGAWDTLTAEVTFTAQTGVWNTEPTPTAADQPAEASAAPQALTTQPAPAASEPENAVAAPVVTPDDPDNTASEDPAVTPAPSPAPDNTADPTPETTDSAAQEENLSAE